MPLGIITILILTVLISFDYLNHFCCILALSKKTAIVMFVSIVFSYTMYPVNSNGITIYWQPFLLILVFSIYQMIKSGIFLKPLLLASFSALILWLIALKIPPQPIGLIYEPFFIYAFILFLINIIFIRKKQFVILNSALSVCFFGILMILTKTHNSLFCPDAFSAICVSSGLSFLLKGCVKNAPDYCR